MKLRTNILSLLAVTLLAATACNDDDYIFEDSAAERIEQGLERYEKALLDGKTWIMEYYPSESIKYGGWIYVLRFDEKHRVRAWFEGSTFADDSYVETTYAVEYTTGPMLKFVDYNDYLHFFAFPGDYGYQGLEGDYEFSFMRINPGPEIIVRGSKTGNDMRLTLLPSGYEPEEYVEAVRESQRIVTPTTLKCMVNGKQVGTLTRESAFVEDNFEQYVASKTWTLSYTCQIQTTDPQGNPVFDDQGNPVCYDKEVNDRLTFIHYPDHTMKLYEPYTFQGMLDGISGQTMQTLAWEQGTTPTADHFVCTDSFYEIKFVQ